MRYSRSVNIEMPLNNVATTQFKFPYQPFLRGKKVVAICGNPALYGIVSGLGNYFGLAQASTTSPVPFGASFITLQDTAGKQFVQNLPLIELATSILFNVKEAVGTDNDLYAINTNGIFNIIPREVVWENSFVLFPRLVPAPYCLSLTVFYE